METDPNALRRKTAIQGQQFNSGAAQQPLQTTPTLPPIKPTPLGPLTDNGNGTASHQPPAPAPAPSAPPSLYESMQKRMAAVQSGQPDPGNADLYGFNQTLPSGAPGGPGAAGAPAAPTPAAPPAAAPAAAPGQPPATIADSFKDALIKRLNPTAPSMDDPALKGQADAFHVAQERARDGARRAMAERAAQEGGAGVNSGAFNQGLAGLYQQQGENEASFNAGLLGDAQNKQDSMLMQALGIGGQVTEGQANRDLQSVMQDKSLSLQDKLAALDAAVRREGISSQAATAASDIGLRRELGQGQLNLGLLSALMGHDQFGRSLNQQGAQFGQSLDQAGLLGLLSGL